MGKTRCINCMKMIDEETAFCPHCGYGQKGEPSPFGLKPGTILRGRYLVGRGLGQGGFGLTYVGYDLTLEIKTAIKEYFPSGLATRNSTMSNQVQRNASQIDQENWQAGCDSFLKEARRMAKIDSLPGIVRVRDTFPENQTAYIVMDFVEGETLKQRLSKTGPMKYSECISLLRPLMESLDKVHKQGLIHRDISPDNIMVQPDGSVCLLDFGAAKDISFQQTVASQQIAKKGFSPPEQYREKGSIGPWTDVYALCATIYYCITGKLVPEAVDRMYEDTLGFDVFLSESLSEAAVGAMKDGLKLRTEERIRTVEELLKRLDGTGTQQNDRASSWKGYEEPQDRGAVGQEDSAAPQENKTAPGKKEEEWPDGNRSRQESGEKRQGSDTAKSQETQDFGTAVAGAQKKISKKVIGAAAVAAVLVLVVVGLAFGSGRKDVGGQTAISNQTEEELPDDAGQTQDKEPEEAEDIRNDEEIVTDGEEEAHEAFNMLMADNTCEISEEKYGDTQMYGTVMGSEISRENIVSVQFVDTLDDAAADAWDVSQEKDGTVMAWTQPDASDDRLLELWIGADGKIAATDCSGMFEAYYNVEVINFNGCFDTSLTTNMEGMFGECYCLKQLDVNDFDTSQVTDMRSMFDSCVDLTQLDVSGFDTSQVTDMGWMFSNTGLIELNVSGFDTSRVTDMRNMFDSCFDLTQLDVSGFDTGQVTDMRKMFYSCIDLTQLDVSGFDTSQVTDMAGMFLRCSNLTQLDVRDFDTSQVTDMAGMFWGCSNLTQLDVSGFDTSQVTDMGGMFFGCSNLTQLDVSGFDTSQVTDMDGMFDGCGVTAEEAGLKIE